MKLAVLVKLQRWTWRRRERAWAALERERDYAITNHNRPRLRGEIKELETMHDIGSELLVAEEGRWDQMAERSRAAEIHGFPRGLDATHTEEAYAAGNAMPPPMARWLAEIVTREIRR